MCKVEKDKQINVDDKKNEVFKPRIVWRNVIAFMFMHYWALKAVYMLAVTLDKFPWYTFGYGECF